MGKGPKRRKGSDDKKFDSGFDNIDMSKKSTDHKNRKGKQGSKGKTTFGPY